MVIYNYSWDPTVGDELTMVRCRMSQLADLPSRVAGFTTGTRPADGGANLGIDLTFWENTGRLFGATTSTTVLPGDDLFAPNKFWMVLMVLETVCIKPNSF